VGAPFLERLEAEVTRLSEGASLRREPRLSRSVECSSSTRP